MNLETIIQEKVHALPTVKQEKVLAFVEDLADEKSNGHETQNDEIIDAEKEVRRLSIIGIGNSGKGDISERAEEILMEGIDKRSGWTLKEKIVDWHWLYVRRFGRERFQTRSVFTHL